MFLPIWLGTHIVIISIIYVSINKTMCIYIYIFLKTCAFVFLLISIIASNLFFLDFCQFPYAPERSPFLPPLPSPLVVLLKSIPRSIRHPKGRSSLQFIQWNVCPIGSMYGAFTYIYQKFMIHVGKYSIHGSYGYGMSPPIAVTFRIGRHFTLNHDFFFVRELELNTSMATYTP